MMNLKLGSNYFEKNEKKFLTNNFKSVIKNL